MRIKQDRALYRPNPELGCTEIKLRQFEDVPGSELYTYVNRSGHLAGVAFAGRRQKPDWRYQFRDDQQREYRVHKWLEGLREQLTYKRKKTEPHNFKPGQLFCISWGYDQTNIDYYKLTELKGKTMGYVVPIAQKTVRTATAADYVTPDPDTLRSWDVLLGVEKTGERGKWKRMTAKGWSCDGRYFASPCDADTERYQTAAGYGH